jgi:hypothetical protein
MSFSTNGNIADTSSDKERRHRVSSDFINNLVATYVENLPSGMVFGFLEDARRTASALPLHLG